MEEETREETSVKQVASTAPLGWRENVPLKRPLTFNGVYSAISQKTELLWNSTFVKD
jgi:hypothetical protein